MNLFILAKGVGMGAGVEVVLPVSPLVHRIRVNTDSMHRMRTETESVHRTRVNTESIHRIRVRARN